MTLEQRVFRETLVLNLTCAFLVFIYSAAITQFRLSWLLPAVVIVTGIVIVTQFTVAPFVNHIFSHSLSVRIEDWKKNGLDEKGRTLLLEAVVHFPERMRLENVLLYFICSCFLYLLYDRILAIPYYVNIMSYAACLFGTFVSGFITENFWRKRCSAIACTIVAQGINDEYVMRKKCFGLPLRRQLVEHIIVPVCCTAVISILILVMSYVPFDNPSLWPLKSAQLTRMILVLVINFLIQAVLAVLFYAHIQDTNKSMSLLLEVMKKGNVLNASVVNTDLSDEIGYNFYLVNRMLFLFRTILKRSTDIGRIILESSADLITVSNQTSASALEQSAGSREIVATMENVNKQSHDIACRIDDVVAAARKTAADVVSGSTVLKEHLEKMIHISEASESTIRGIQELGRRINGIWEIVTLISSIADQTKIIAFNAELEAAGVHDAENDFRTVSVEIRRLANNTMDSTEEIKERINEIRTASDNLITLSKSGSEKVAHVMEFTGTLEEKFTHISTSAETNAGDDEEIKLLVRQQTAAFEQIVVTLKQISAGVDSFTGAARRITGTASKLHASADELGIADKDIEADTSEQISGQNNTVQKAGHIYE
ncbi:MAG: methyl-accepting chemotaxis protein [Treponema sp.]|nr:methyl-accepting chemotaxis protein [Treponema sp.]